MNPGKNVETVLVTGASSGIGVELAKCFAGDGSRLVLVARSKDPMEKLAAELRDKHKVEVIVLPADLAQPETSEKIFSELQAKGVAVDVLINNAGFGLQDSFAQLSLQRQLEMIQVNVTALVELTGLFLPQMIQRRRGGVLNVSSVAGFLPGPNMAIYYATKAFVTSFTEALGEELLETGVTTTALCPGPTESNFGAVARGNRMRKVKTPKMSARAVAEIGHSAFRSGKFIVVPGAWNKLLVFLMRIVPRSILRKAVKRYTDTA